MMMIYFGHVSIFVGRNCNVRRKFLREAALLCLQLHCRREGRLTSNAADKLNYGVMLLEFLELYGLHFNYQWTGISVRNGGRYIEKTDSMSHGLYIEDPTNPGNIKYKHMVFVEMIAVSVISLK